MKQILAVLSVVAVVASLQVIGGDKKGACSSCPSAKTAVGATAATEGSACAASKTEVGSEAKSECASGSCEKGKTAVGEQAKSECSQKTLTFKVGGAACEESCGNLVKTLTSIKGISAAESCSKSSMTKISYDPATVKSEQIAAAILKAGYKVEGQQVSLPVEGMACQACSTKVGKTLTSLEGVISGSACHESKKATVLYDPAKVKEQQIVAAINGAGFKASAQ
jgi:copper ion binding protein